jgi:hypothetical protein
MLSLAGTARWLHGNRATALFSGKTSFDRLSCGQVGLVHDCRKSSNLDHTLALAERSQSRLASARCPPRFWTADAMPTSCARVG